MARIIRALKNLFSSYDPFTIWNEWNMPKIHGHFREQKRRQAQIKKGMIHIS